MKFTLLPSALAAFAAVVVSCGPGEDEAGRRVGQQPATEPTYAQIVKLPPAVKLTVVIEPQIGQGENTPSLTTETAPDQVIRGRVEVTRLTPRVTVLPTPTPGPLEVTQTDFKLAHDGGFIIDLLRFLPDRPDARVEIGVDNLVPMWESNAKLGFPRPGPAAPADWLGEYVNEVTRATGGRFPDMAAAPFICCPREYLTSFAPYDYTGFDMRNVDHALKAGERQEYEVVIGDYDSKEFAERLRGCEACVPPDKIENYGGLAIYSWGEDFTGSLRKRFAPPLLDHVGRGGRLVVGDRFALRALSTAAMKGMIDAQGSRVSSLSDNPDYQLAARALVALGVYAVGFSSGGMSIGDVGSDDRHTIPGFESVEAQREAVGIGTLLKPFELAAAGLAFPDSDGEVTGAIVLVHATEADARSNADLLPARMRLSWSNEVRYWGNHWWDSIERIEVAVYGPVLMARLHAGADAQFKIVPWSILYPGPVLVHE